MKYITNSNIMWQHESRNALKNHDPTIAMCSIDIQEFRMYQMCHTAHINIYTIIKYKTKMTMNDDGDY